MSFDLNINNYTKSELIEMFELPPNYDNNLIEMKETKLKENISNNKLVSQDVKQSTINFLTQAKTILLGDVQTQKPDPEFMKKISALYNFNYDLKPVKTIDEGDHIIQDRGKVPWARSAPREFVPGSINPLARTTIRKIINVDTRFRENYYTTSATNFTFTLPAPMNNVVKMDLASIELPISFSIISKQYNNNFFMVTANGVSKMVEIDDGNYTWDGVETAINGALDLLGGDFQYITFYMKQKSGNGTAEMMVGLEDDSILPNPIRFELNFQTDRYGNEDHNTPLPLKLGWLLGFRNGLYTGNQNYVSEGMVDMSGPRYLYLVINDYNNNVEDSFVGLFNSSILEKNILTKITLQNPVFTVYSERNFNLTTVPRTYFGPVNIYNLQIQLLDEFGRIVNINNMDFSFSLNLTIDYAI
jgi:hypothetical protein